MKIAVTSQNFRTITGHAGKTTRFFVFEGTADEAPRELERLELPAAMMVHEFRGTGAHPLQAVDALITAGAGEGFVRRLAVWGVRVVITGEADPATAVLALLKGELAEGAPHVHGHDGHDGHDGHEGCGGCGHD